MHSRVDLTNTGLQESFVTITRPSSNVDTIFSWKYNDLDICSSNDQIWLLTSLRPMTWPSRSRT